MTRETRGGKSKRQKRRKIHADFFQMKTKWLLITAVWAGFELQGCFSPTQSLQKADIPSLSVDICTTRCILNSHLFAAISLNTGCYCLDSLDSLIKQNSNECKLKCVDNAPCGGDPDRLSGYKLTNSDGITTVPFNVFVLD